MAKINYNISEISDVKNRSITRANHINTFVVNDDNVLVPGNDLNIYKIIDDIKKIHGTILFTVNKYIENDNKEFNLLIKNTTYKCSYTASYLDIDNMYAALYIGNDEFALYKFDNDEAPMITTMLQLVNRVNSIDVRLAAVERLNTIKDKTWQTS